MRGLGLPDGLVQAATADFLSLTAFEVGCSAGWPSCPTCSSRDRTYPNSPVYWLLMQVGMVLGFTAWPVNVWLIRKGIEEAM